MPFRFNDLMIDAKAGPYTGPATPCFLTWPQPVGSDHPAQQLEQLKAGLREALAQIETRERDLAAGDKPQTLAEADDLETRLEGALAELREHKKSLV